MTINNETRQNILDIAITLFSKHGLNGVSTAEIARAANVNKALIFYYFGSKKDLYRAAFCIIRDRLIERLNSAAFPATSESGYIEAFIRTQISFLRETPEVVNFIIRELIATKEGSSLILDDMSELFKLVLQDLGGAVRQGVDNGTLRAVDPFQTVLSIISLDVFFFLQKTLIGLMYSDYLPDASLVEANREDHVIDLIMNGIRTKGKA